MNLIIGILENKRFFVYLYISEIFKICDIYKKRTDMIKFRTLEDFTEENVEAVIREMEEIYKENKQKNQVLNEQSTPHFSTFKDAMEYLNAIPFEEWENNMREKYGL